MKRIVVLLVIALVTGIFATPGFSHSYELTGKALTYQWPGNTWDGRHSFQKIYCVTFPDPNRADSMTTAIFNRAISLTRVSYKNDNALLFVIASSIPKGRSSEEDMAKTGASNNAAAKLNPKYIRANDVSSPFGSAQALIIRNSQEKPAKGPFPLERSIAVTPDGLLHTLSVHRLFARGSNRFEVAALRYFQKPLPKEEEQPQIDDLNRLVERTADALCECTKEIPSAKAPPTSPNAALEQRESMITDRY